MTKMRKKLKELRLNVLQLITKEKAKVIIAFKISCSIFFDLTKQPERENFLKKEDRVMVLIFFFAEKAIIAKSNIILDVKPWDDETDMAEVERLVRNIKADGLLWGAGKSNLLDLT